MPVSSYSSMVAVGSQHSSFEFVIIKTYYNTSHCFCVSGIQDASGLRFGLGSLGRLRSRCRLGLQAPKIRTGARGPTVTMVPSHGRWPEASVSHEVVPSTGLHECFLNMACPYSSQLPCLAHPIMCDTFFPAAVLHLYGVTSSLKSNDSEGPCLHYSTPMHFHISIPFQPHLHTPLASSSSVHPRK